jgi:hypothetical protein
MLVKYLAGWFLAGLGVALGGTITQDYDFTATFSSGPGAGLPGSELTGSIVMTYDPAASSTYGALNSFTSDLPGGYSGPYTFFFDQPDGLIGFGNDCGMTGCTDSSAGSFFVSFYVDSTGLNTTPYDAALNSGDGTSFTFNTTLVPGASAPEPATSLLIGLGLLTVPAFRRLRSAHTR